MNWVGGSRSRVILKQQRRKQKEYFEKKKLKSKMKLLDVSSSPKSSAVSLDLLNLYVVNQISTKKDNTESVRKPVHVDMSGGLNIPVKRHNIELPMSPPRTRYASDLDDIQNRLQKQVMDSRRQHLSEKVKYQNNVPQVPELTYGDSSVGHEEDTAAAFSAGPLSSSGFWPSNSTQSSKENFNTNLMWDSWEQTYEEKQEKEEGNTSDQDPWILKTPSQCIFKQSDTELQELFKPLNRPDYMNSASENPVLMTSKEPESIQRRSEPFFSVVKEPPELVPARDEHDSSFLTIFEDESQPDHNDLSTKHFNPFVNQSSSADFFPGPDDRNQMAERSFTYDTGEVHPAINAKGGSVDRHLKGIFTAPEQVLFKSNIFSNASYEGNRAPYKTCLQDYHHENQYYLAPSENREELARLEKHEAFTYRHGQQINLQEDLQSHSRNKSDSSNGKESAWRQDQLFGFEEFATVQEKEYEFGMSPKLHELKKDTESSLSSRSPSYSPRQTESCFSSSPDLSEEEDAAEAKACVKAQPMPTGKAGPTSVELRGSPTIMVPLHPSRSLAKGEANSLQQEDSIAAAMGEGSEEAAAPRESSSFLRAGRREQVARRASCDVCSQTERPASPPGKVDVGTQCGSPRLGSCLKVQNGSATGEHKMAASPQNGSGGRGHKVAVSPQNGSAAGGHKMAALPQNGSAARGHKVAASPQNGSAAGGHKVAASPQNGGTAGGHKVAASPQNGSAAGGHKVAASPQNGGTAGGHKVAASPQNGSAARGHKVAASPQNGCAAGGHKMAAPLPTVRAAASEDAAEDARRPVQQRPGSSARRPWSPPGACPPARRDAERGHVRPPRPAAGAEGAAQLLPPA